jgi:type IV secretory pathway VirB2 component (pilin)
MRRNACLRSECPRQTAFFQRCSRILGVKSVGIKALGIVLTLVAAAFGQAGGSPWENAVNALKTSFTGPIATGLSLVAIVVGGLTFAYGEGHSKKALAGIIFGVGMAIGAVNFMSWLFP